MGMFKDQKKEEKKDEKEEVKELAEEEREEKEESRPEAKAKTEEKVAKAATAVKMTTLAAQITMAKGEDEEDSEDINLDLIVLLFTLVIVFLTLCMERPWKDAVRIRDRPQNALSSEDRSHPAARKETGEEDEAEEEKEESEEEKVPEDRVEGSGQQPVDRSDRPSDQNAPLPEEGQVQTMFDGSDIVAEFELVEREEAIIWADLNRTPLTPPGSQDQQQEEDPDIGFYILKTKWGKVCHCDRNCPHLHGPNVTPPVSFTWCVERGQVALQTRGRPPLLRLKRCQSTRWPTMSKCERGSKVSMLCWLFGRRTSQNAWTIG